MAREFVVNTSDVSFSYSNEESENIHFVLDGISLGIKRGSYLALLGRNGSGKSTFTKLVDVIELPTKGQVEVFGIITSDESRYFDIRKRTGCVFQNPDNQIVGTTVEEDVAFGPENIGIPNPELRNRVDEALKYVGLYEKRHRESASLSGGQKQKLAIAGILAMRPELLILDEATAMLDPVSRDELLTIVEKLIKEEHMTVLTVTHDVAEAMRTDYVYCLDEGKIILDGEPQDVLSNIEEMYKAGLDSPLFSKLTNELTKQTGVDANEEAYKSFDGMMEYIRGLKISLKAPSPDKQKNQESIFEITNLSCHYETDTAVLKDINLSVKKGELLAIVGKSGSGKTTLISHFNGIIKPEGNGDVVLNLPEGKLSTRNKKEIKRIREKVGLVFQYPEYQLFEETVYKDIAYGPTRMGLTEEQVRDAVLEAAKAMGVKDSMLEKSPFELSGGQQRRVAMAGVIAMKPDVLVLDEPAAGLDAAGRREMFKLIHSLTDNGTTVILVTHNMDEAYEHADRICVIKNGEIAALDTPREIFKKDCKEFDIDMPLLIKMLENVSSELKLNESDRALLLTARSVAEAASIIGGAYAK